MELIIMSDTLIVCFSKSGHTKAIAEEIAKVTNAPLHEILTEKTYPKSYVMTILESRKEFKKDERPTLIDSPIENFDSYSRIIIGFPIWFFTCPMAVVSFLEKYNFAGKNIYPFFTSGGSGGDKATAKIKDVCKDATVHNAINAKNLNNSEKISEWLKN